MLLAGDQNYCLEVGPLCWNALLCDEETPGLEAMTFGDTDGFGDPLHPNVMGRSILGRMKMFGRWACLSMLY